MYFLFNDTATTEIYSLSLHDALPIWLFFLGARQGGSAVGVDDVELPPRSQDADDRRHDRKKNHDSDNVVDAPGDIGHEMTEKIAAEDHRSHPEDAAEDVKRQVSAVWHPRRTRDRRTKRPNDGNKACQNHSPSPVLLIKIMRALEVAATEKERVLAAIERCPRRTSNPVTNLVPH